MKNVLAEYTLLTHKSLLVLRYRHFGFPELPEVPWLDDGGDPELTDPPEEPVELDLSEHLAPVSRMRVGIVFMRSEILEFLF